MKSFPSLIHQVSRLFYSPECVTMIGLLSQYTEIDQEYTFPRVTEDEITKYTTLPSRIVRSKLDQLRNDKLVYQIQVQEGQAKKKAIYYIDPINFMNSVKYKLYKMEEKSQNQAKRAQDLEALDFVCQKCGKRFDAIEVGRFWNSENENFQCDYCSGILEEQKDQGKNAIEAQKHDSGMDQLLHLRKLVEEADIEVENTNFQTATHQTQMMVAGSSKRGVSNDQGQIKVTIKFQDENEGVKVKEETKNVPLPWFQKFKPKEIKKDQVDTENDEDESEDETNEGLDNYYDKYLQEYGYQSNTLNGRNDFDGSEHYNSSENVSDIEDGYDEDLENNEDEEDEEENENENENGNGNEDEEDHEDEMEGIEQNDKTQMNNLSNNEEDENEEMVENDGDQENNNTTRNTLHMQNGNRNGNGNYNESEDNNDDDDDEEEEGNNDVEMDEDDEK